jgi:exodeoxyribonuclease VII small subunit
MRGPKPAAMSAANPPEISFEQAMERLEEIVAAMETDRMPLEEMVDAYEEGMKLLQNCRHRIENARHRIESIALKADGKAELSNFDPNQMDVADDKPRSNPPSRRRPPAKPETSNDADDEIRLF